MKLGMGTGGNVLIMHVIFLLPNTFNTQTGDLCVAVNTCTLFQVSEIDDGKQLDSNSTRKHYVLLSFYKKD